MAESATAFAHLRRQKRKIIQPYLQIVRKKDYLQQRALEKMKDNEYVVEEAPDEMYNYLTAFNSEKLNIPFVLRKTADILKETTDSDDIFVWLVEDHYVILLQEVTCPIIRFRIKPDNVVASHVAYHKTHLKVDNCHDMRFLLNFGHKTVDPLAVMVVPVITPDEECVAVIEMYRSSAKDHYKNNDLQITLILAGWIGAAIQQSREKTKLLQVQKINADVLDLVNSFYTGTKKVDEVISQLMMDTKTIIDAEKGKFYIIDPESEDIQATVLEQGLYDEKLYRKKLPVKLIDSHTVAGAVARHQKSFLLTDLMDDKRFNRTYEKRTGKLRKCILAIPIKCGKKVYGVLELENKRGKNHNFDRIDETLVRSVWKYSSLVLSYENIRVKLPVTENKIEVHKSILARQVEPCIHDQEIEFNDESTLLPSGFHLFQWTLTGVKHQMTFYAYSMLLEVIGKNEVDLKLAKDFVMIVRGMYRQNPYHNFEHAFTTAHAVYCILLRNNEEFTPLESRALIVGALCHDIEHMGVNNSFLVLCEHNIYKLYPDACLENYHFLVTNFVLKYCPFIISMSANDYIIFMRELKANILATDLSHHFKIRFKISNVIGEKGNLDLHITEQKYFAKCVIMTSADLSGCMKPFQTVAMTVSKLYQEFFHQGDMEKDLGFTPLPIMDYNKVQQMPKDQIQFMKVIVIPCITLLKLIFPNCEEAYELAMKVYEQWLSLKDSPYFFHVSRDARFDSF